MQMRVATVSDLGAVIACADGAFGSFSRRRNKRDGKPDGDLTSQIEEGSIHLSCDGARVLGYISLWPVADHLFVDTVAVLPSHHGQGRGSHLLAFAENEALRLGLGSVRLFTKENMADNLVFYRHRGYRETGRCDDDGFSRVFYSKAITPRTAAVSGSRRAVRYLSHWFRPPQVRRMISPEELS